MSNTSVMRRILIAIAFALGLAAGPNAAASPCLDGVPAETHGSNEINVTNPVTGSHIYVERPGTSSGQYAGTHGSFGYIEADGDTATRTTAVEGQTADGNTAAFSVYTNRNGRTAGVCVTVLGTTVHPII